MLLFFIFISSGLFLGWSLGSNDAANVFGSAVGSKMVSFRRAATVAAIFVVLGAVFQGRGGAETLNALGAVDALAGGFTVSLCAAFVVFLMTKRSLPVSTSQAVVGAIIGWTLFTGNTMDYRVLSKIVSTWISGPILGMIFSALLYLLARVALRKAKIHIIKLDHLIRISLILAGAFGAYSLGANNIANVMGVFVSAAPDILLDFGLFTLDGVQILFLLGSIAIAVGIFTYSERVMNTVGNGILSLSPEAAIVVVASHGIVLFLFSSTTLSNMLISIGLPPMPMVPVSSTQVILGSVLGIGIIKGTREIHIKTVYGIALGWITTPVIAGVFTFFMLFFVQNVFDLQVTTSIPVEDVVETAPSLVHKTAREINLLLPGLVVLGTAVIVVLVIIVFRQQKLRLKSENELLQQQNELYAAQKTISGFEINAMQREKEKLRQKLDAKKREFAEVVMNLSEQRAFLENILKEVEEIKSNAEDQQTGRKLQELTVLLRQRMSFNNEKEDLYIRAEELHNDFLAKLEAGFPQLTDNEKRLAVFIRLNFSIKEVATLLNISPKSVEVARYRLKKTLGLSKDDDLILFIHNI
jgi:inorganic phosphate transporter, PiT family